jgi:two-component system cell cycle response regulator DivK
MSKILIIEDNVLNLELFLDLLEMHGYQVVSADNGPEGIELARQEQPDLILLDLSLPGMDGLEIAGRLQAEPLTQQIPLVAVTAHSHPADRERVIQAGFRGHLTKPINVHTFADEIRQFL